MGYAPGLASLIKIKNKLSKTFCKWEDPQKKKIMKDNSRKTKESYYK